MTTTSFLVTRAARSSATPWEIYESRMNSAKPITSQEALAIAQNMDSASSKTLSVRPVA
jgi:hypothetical protein